MIGKIQLLISLAVLPLIWFCRQAKNKTTIAAIAVGWIFLLASVFLTSQASAFIWRLVPVMAFIQYPWRFLIFATLASSFLAGGFTIWLGKNSKFAWLTTLFLLIGLWRFNTKYFQPRFYFDQTASDYINEEVLKWRASKISDEYLPRDFPVPETKEEAAWEKIEVLTGQAIVREKRIRFHRYDFEIVAKTPTEILIKIAYFPGWRVRINNQSVEPEIEAGRIKLALPAGQHQICVKLANTPVRALANLISLLALAGLIGFMLKLRHGRDRA